MTPRQHFPYLRLWQVVESENKDARDQGTKQQRCARFTLTARWAVSPQHNLSTSTAPLYSYETLTMQSPRHESATITTAASRPQVARALGSAGPKRRRAHVRAPGRRPVCQRRASKSISYSSQRPEQCDHTHQQWPLLHIRNTRLA